MDTLKLAEKIAIKAHLGQTRRDGVTPYIEHPIKVAKIVEEILGFGDDYKAVALLHDVIEDNKEYSVEELVALGVEAGIANAVFLLTKQKGQDYLDYIQKVKNNHYAKMVKIADILANLTDSPTDKQIKKYLPALKELIS